VPGSRLRGVDSVTFGLVVPTAAILPASALALQAAGAQPLRGAVADLDVLRAGAAQADGVIYLAFGNDYSSADSRGPLGHRGERCAGGPGRAV